VALIDATFDAHRPMLMRTAYRMLGSLSDAEDVVQEAFLRWAGADRDSVAVPGAFLRRIVTRLCLDHLKSARVRRETYTGPWLPDPLVEDEPVEDVTLPLMLALERLSPLERAAFLLHDVFGESFEVHRRGHRPRSRCLPPACRAGAGPCAQRTPPLCRRPQSRHGHRRGLLSGLSRRGCRGAQRAAGAGGAFPQRRRRQTPAAGRVLHGLEEVLRAHAAIARLRTAPSQFVRHAFVNGLPGFVTREADGLLQTTALLIEDGLIRAIYVMRNPDKLGHLS
jgi:RNA polymerase sigma-70 factor (ECF subfamily)